MSQPDPANNAGVPENSDVEAFADAMAEDTSSPLVNTTELQVKIDDLQNKLLRTQAEMENFRRRTYREQEDARKFKPCVSCVISCQGWTDSIEPFFRPNKPATFRTC